TPHLRTLHRSARVARGCHSFSTTESTAPLYTDDTVVMTCCSMKGVRGLGEMHRLRRVVGNTAISLIGQLITWTTTLLLTVTYGRFVGGFKLGELSFATTFVLLIGIPIERGFNQQVTREVVQRPMEALRYLSNTLLIKGALWLMLYGLILLVCWLLGYSLEVRTLVAICGLTLLSNALITTFAALHYSFERVVYSV